MAASHCRSDDRCGGEPLGAGRVPATPAVAVPAASPVAMAEVRRADALPSAPSSVAARVRPRAPPQVRCRRAARRRVALCPQPASGRAVVSECDSGCTKADIGASIDGDVKERAATGAGAEATQGTGDRDKNAAGRAVRPPRGCACGAILDSTLVSAPAEWRRTFHPRAQDALLHRAAKRVGSSQSA